METGLGTRYPKLQVPVNSISRTLSTCQYCLGRHLLLIHFVDHSLYSQCGLPQESVDGGTTLGKLILDLKIQDIGGDGLKGKSLQDINNHRLQIMNNSSHFYILNTMKFARFLYVF